jgi:hypothetical protein
MVTLKQSIHHAISLDGNMMLTTTSSIGKMGKQFPFATKLTVPGVKSHEV